MNQVTEFACIEAINFGTIVVENSLFDGNVGTVEACIVIECEIGDVCDFQLTNSSFTNNVAGKRGGAIYYSSYPPILTNVTFSNNSAPYGQNLASYAKTLRLWVDEEWKNEVTLPEIASGQDYTETLYFAVFDVDDQIINTEDQDTIVVKSNTPGFTPQGVTLRQFRNGTATIEGISFDGVPGEKFVFEVESRIFDQEILSAIHGIQNPDFNLTVEFRKCQSGEV